jgi:stage V sporulation protein SpoVS
VGRVLVFDLQGSITLLAGALIALITLFTSYGHVEIPGVGSIQLNQQAGVLLIIASLATLAGVDEVFSEGVVELATRRRLRAERDRVRSERDRVQAENEALDELDSKLDALFSSSSTSSTPPQNTSDNSEA